MTTSRRQFLIGSVATASAVFGAFTDITRGQKIPVLGMISLHSTTRCRRRPHVCIQPVSSSWREALALTG